MLTKEQQTYKAKKPKITKEEKAYLEYLNRNRHTYKCFVCGAMSNIEFHHVKLKSTDKKNHKRLIPLCVRHHHGRELSPHGTPKKWRETYTMKEQNEYAENMYYKYVESWI